ncbi:hypothetical protein OG579_03825 [Williamsia herbipolensis]|uniref:Uncharacterized protein n=1 Tax=Williamsia herbipolensis TaxID=1603258 RepID=A0AAU4K4P9_9NOCA|nr:hypothetical protein [Williamsia herbipolensis]
MAPALVGLDLLTEEDLDRAHKLHDQAREYLTLSRNSEQAVARKVAELADKLAADPKTTPEKVVGATTGIPDARAVTSIAETLERSLNRQAQAIVLARVGEAVGRLNARLAEIADETESVASDLSNITTPQQAIDAGAVDQWRRAQALIAEYKDIASVVYELRELRTIPRPRSSESGPHWRFLRDEDQTSWLPQDATAWQKHVRDMQRRPWVPASEDEAKAVLDQWNREAVSA